MARVSYRKRLLIERRRRQAHRADGAGVTVSGAFPPAPDTAAVVGKVQRNEQSPSTSRLRPAPLPALLTLAVFLVAAGAIGGCAFLPLSSDEGLQSETIDTLVLSGDESNIVYDNITFTGGTSSQAVVTISRASNITFRNCTFDKGGGWNSVSINDSSGSVRNISFENCRWLGAGRMNIEITSRPTSASMGYSDINITDSIFEPSGSQCVSYDGGQSAGNSRFINNLIKGAGNDTSQRWGSGLEINGPSNMVVKNNQIWQTRAFALNLQRHTSAPSGWVIQNNLLDAARRAQSAPQDGTAQQVLCLSVYGGTFTNNRITSAPPGGGAAYWTNSHDMDWRGTTWSDSRGGSYTRPIQVDSSGNQLGE